MLAQPLDDDLGKCSPHSETIRHDYVNDYCEKCKLRKELRAKRKDLLGYLKRQNDDVEPDTTLHDRKESSPILLDETKEDFVLYIDEQDQDRDQALDAALDIDLGTIDGEKHITVSGNHALGIIDDGEIVYSHEEDDGEERKRDLTPGPDEEEELFVAVPPRKKRRPKWKTI